MSMNFRRFGLSGLVATLFVVMGASPGWALSFLVPDGNKITNLSFIQSNSTEAGFGASTYDGASDHFSLNLKLDSFELNNDPGQIFSSFPTDVVLNIQVTQQSALSGNSNQCGGFLPFGNCSAPYDSGGFTLWDLNGAGAGDNELLLAGAFLPAGNLNLTVAGTTVTLAGLSGDYALAGGNPILFDALGPDGSLLTINIAPLSAITFDGTGGLNSFSMNATAGMIPDDPQPIHNPEPGTGLLLGGGLLAVAAIRRRRS